MTTFQTFGSHNFLFQYDTNTKFFRFVDNLFDFIKLFTESKYYISVLKYVSSNYIVYFSPHALFSQAQSHIKVHLESIHSVDSSVFLVTHAVGKSAESRRSLVEVGSTSRVKSPGRQVQLESHHAEDHPDDCSARVESSRRWSLARFQ